MSCSVSLTFRKAFGGSMQCGNSTWHFLDRMTRWPAGKGLQLRAEEALVLERGPRSPEPLEFLVASPAFHQGTTPPGHLAAYDVAIREVVLVRRLDELDGLWHPLLVAAAVVLDAGDVGVDVRAQALRADIIEREARHARGGLLFVAAAALKSHGHEERTEEQNCDAAGHGCLCLFGWAGRWRMRGLKEHWARLE